MFLIMVVKDIIFKKRKKQSFQQPLSPRMSHYCSKCSQIDSQEGTASLPRPKKPPPKIPLKGLLYTKSITYRAPPATPSGVSYAESQLRTTTTSVPICDNSLGTLLGQKEQ